MLGLFAATPASVGLWAERGWCEGLQHPSVAALCCSCPAVVMEGAEAGGMQPAKCRDQPLLHSSLAPPIPPQAFLWAGCPWLSQHEVGR